MSMMVDGPFPYTLAGMFAQDPFANAKDGAQFSVEPVFFGGTDGSSFPRPVGNATFFEGAVLAVGVREPDQQSVVGTAVMVAPGLAVTASHVLSDVVSAFRNGTASLACLGLTSAGLELWRVPKLNVGGDDIAFISLQLASSIPPGWCLRCIRMTTRTPKVGEEVTITGLRIPTARRASEKVFQFEGNLYASVGKVTRLHFPERDRVLMPYPTLEIECGSLGGMSGGAVLDDQGHLLGVVSRGWDTEDRGGPTYAEWIVPGLNRLVEIPWPPKFYQHPVRVMDIDARVIRIEGRDRIWIAPDNSLQYKPWSDRQQALPKGVLRTDR